MIYVNPQTDLSLSAQMSSKQPYQIFEPTQDFNLTVYDMCCSIKYTIHTT